MASADQIVNPVARTDVIKNPGIGYQTFYTSAANDTQLPSATMYVRYWWSQIETAPGTYNWSVIDTDLARAVAAGQRFAFRIMPYADGQTGPKGLKSAGFAGFNFAYNATSGIFMPDLNNSTVQADMATTVAAIKTRYGSNPNIDSIDIGFVGSFGQYWTGSTTPALYLPSTASLEKWFDNWSNLPFPLLIDGDLTVQNPGANEDHTAFSYAMSKNIGWRIDGWGGYEGAPYDYMDYQVPWILAAAPNAWKNAPIYLEPYYTMQNWVTGGWWQQALNWAVTNHVSAFHNKSAPIPSVMLSAVQSMLTHLGYRFVLTQAQLPTSVAADTSMPLTLNWNNAGNAPIYIDRHILVKIGNQVTDTGVTMKGFLPGTRTDTLTVNTAGLAAGTYPVAIGLAAPGSQNPDITLAIQGAGPWYPLANVTIATGPTPKPTPSITSVPSRK
jgi:hypothetical protein